MEQSEYKKMEEIEKEHFWFVAKRSFLKTVLNRYSSAGAKVLDVGCGTGAILEFLESNGYTAAGIDNSTEALRYCKEKGLDAKNGLAEKIDYADESFDVVLASDVLEHLDDDLSAVKEVLRVLKKGGVFIATVPAHQNLWSYHDTALHHKRRYSFEEFKNLLNKNFKIELITWIHSCIFFPVWLMRKIGAGLKNKEDGSDVKKINPVINKVAGIFYWPELLMFRLFKKLPWGVSLLVVARKI